VEELSRTIATNEGDEEYFISHGRIIQLENSDSTPSIYKLFTLSAIYGVKITELLGLYVDLDHIARHQMGMRLQVTRPAELETEETQRPVTFPVRFDPGFQLGRTNLLSRMVEIWGEVPVALIRHLDIRRMSYGFIGLSDYMMYPLLRPGSFVQYDEKQSKVQSGIWQTEYDRPIYFLELRDAYLCSWCEIRKNRIIAVPHPLSPCRTQEFTYPTEVEVLGRVTAVAARLVNPPPAQPSDTSQIPKRA